MAEYRDKKQTTALGTYSGKARKVPRLLTRYALENRVSFRIDEANPAVRNRFLIEEPDRFDSVLRAPVITFDPYQTYNRSLVWKNYDPNYTPFIWEKEGEFYVDDEDDPTVVYVVEVEEEEDDDDDPEDPPPPPDPETEENSPAVVSIVCTSPWETTLVLDYPAIPEIWQGDGSVEDGGTEEDNGLLFTITIVGGYDKFLIEGEGGEEESSSLTPLTLSLSLSGTATYGTDYTLTLSTADTEGEVIMNMEEGEDGTQSIILSIPSSYIKQNKELDADDYAEETVIKLYAIPIVDTFSSLEEDETITLTVISNIDTTTEEGEGEEGESEQSEGVEEDEEEVVEELHPYLASPEMGTATGLIIENEAPVVSISVTSPYPMPADEEGNPSYPHPVIPEGYGEPLEYRFMVQWGRFFAPTGQSSPYFPINFLIHGTATYGKGDEGEEDADYIIEDEAPVDVEEEQTTELAPYWTTTKLTPEQIETVTNLQPSIENPQAVGNLYLPWAWIEPQLEVGSDGAVSGSVEVVIPVEVLSDGLGDEGIEDIVFTLSNGSYITPFQSQATALIENGGYKFKVLQTSRVEGFNADVALSLTDYIQVGITNTGLGYGAILSNTLDDAEYVYETELSTTTIVLDPTSFVGSVIPTFIYYSGTLLFNGYAHRDNRYVNDMMIGGALTITSSGVPYPMTNYYIGQTLSVTGEVSGTTLTVPEILFDGSGAPIPVEIEPFFYNETLSYRFQGGQDITIFHSSDVYMKAIVLGTNSTSVTGSSGGGWTISGGAYVPIGSSGGGSQIVVYARVYESVGVGRTANRWTISLTTTPSMEYDTSIHSGSALFSPYHLCLHPFLVYNPDSILSPYHPTNWKDIDVTKSAGYMVDGEYADPVLRYGNYSASPYNYGDTLPAFVSRMATAGINFDPISTSSSGTVIAEYNSIVPSTAGNKTVYTITFDSSYNLSYSITGLFVDEIPSPDVIFWNVASTENVVRTKTVTRTENSTIPIQDIKVLPLSPLYTGNVDRDIDMTYVLTMNVGYTNTPSLNTQQSYSQKTVGSMTFTASGTYSVLWNDCKLNLHGNSIPVKYDRYANLNSSGSNPDTRQYPLVGEPPVVRTIETTKESTKDIQQVTPILQGDDVTLCKKLVAQIKRVKSFWVEEKPPVVDGATGDTVTPGETNRSTPITIEHTSPPRNTYLLVTATSAVEYNTLGGWWNKGVSGDTYNTGGSNPRGKRLKVYPRQTTYTPSGYAAITPFNLGGYQFNIPVVSTAMEMDLRTMVITPYNPLDPATHKVYMTEYVFGEEEYWDEQEKLMFFRCTGINSFPATMPGIDFTFIVTYYIMSPDPTTLSLYGGRRVQTHRYHANDNPLPYSAWYWQYSPATRDYPWVMEVDIETEEYTELELEEQAGIDPTDVEVYTITDGVTVVTPGLVTNVAWIESEDDYIYNTDYEWYVDNKEMDVDLGVDTYGVSGGSPAGFYMWANVYVNETIIVSEGNHGASITEYLKDEGRRKHCNLYLAEEEVDGEVIETVELAIAQIPIDTLEKEEWRADIYRFNPTSLKWERRENGVSALSELSAVSPYISYHP